MTKAEQAKALFYQGYNCCQSVFGAFAPEMGLDQETAMRLASGMGAGLGRMRSVCGTCSGMCMAAGLARGYSDPKATQKKTDTYAMIQRLVKQFQADQGSIICKELLGLEKIEDSPQAEARTPEYYKKRPCPELVAYAAGLLEAELAANPRREEN